MKKILIALSALVALSLGASAQVMTHQIKVPDIEGYLTLKGDMHTHTIFSDGNVWPTTRVDEAILDGLDFFVITDHLDGRHQKLANKGLFNCDRDESYRLAAAYAKSRDILVIHGGEITRGMPPGHFNVSFVDSDTKIGEEEDKFEDHFEGMVAGLKEARKQGAFMVWNHPHWSRQAPNGPVWYDEHSRILDMGLMHGLEVFNQFDGFSKEVFHWAMQKNLTIVSGTDAHKLMELWIDYGNGELRPCTLVFAKEKSEAGIREALDNQRTAVLAQHKVYGRVEFLKPLLDAILQVKSVKNTDKKLTIVVHNCSCVPVILSKASGFEDLGYTRDIVIGADSDYTIEVTNAEYGTKFTKSSITFGYEVKNFFTDADVNLKYSFTAALK